MNRHALRETIADLDLATSALGHGHADMEAAAYVAKAASRLLALLGLTERQLAIVQAMLDANRTGGATEYELAERDGAVKAEERKR